MPKNKNNGNPFGHLSLTRFDESLMNAIYTLVLAHDDPEKASLLLVRFNREGLLRGPLSQTIIRGIGVTPTLSQFEIAILQLEHCLQTKGKSIATVSEKLKGTIEIVINHLAQHTNPIDFLNVFILLNKLSLSKATFLQGGYSSKHYRVLGDMADFRLPVFPAIVFQKCLAAGLLTGDAAEMNYGLIIEYAPIWHGDAELSALFITYPIEQLTADLFFELVAATKASITEDSDFKRVRDVLSQTILVADSPAEPGPSNYGRLSPAMYKTPGATASDTSKTKSHTQGFAP